MVEIKDYPQKNYTSEESRYAEELGFGGNYTNRYFSVADGISALSFDSILAKKDRKDTTDTVKCPYTGNSHVSALDFPDGEERLAMYPASDAENISLSDWVSAGHSLADRYEKTTISFKDEDSKYQVYAEKKKNKSPAVTFQDSLVGYSLDNIKSNMLFIIGVLPSGKTEYIYNASSTMVNDIDKVASFKMLKMDS